MLSAKGQITSIIEAQPDDGTFKEGNDEMA
jgi:hypothetical protein